MNLKPDEVRQIRLRQYHNKELPELVGTTKWNLNRDLRPHRKKLGPRNGYRWTFEQVIKILEIFAIPYMIVKD